MLLSIGQFPHGEAGVFNIFVLSGNGALDEVGRGVFNFELSREHSAAKPQKFFLFPC